MPRKISRESAEKKGLKRFYTGVRCKYGHGVERYVCNAKCVECDRIAVQAWALANPQNGRDRQRRRRLKNAERVKALRRATWKRTQETKPWVLRAAANAYRGRKSAAEGRHTAADIAVLFANQEGQCANALCQTALSEGYHVDHVMPLILGGSNWPDNLQLLCAPCNNSKGGKHPDIWRATLSLNAGV